MKAGVTPARVGLLIDYLGEQGGFDENILPTLQLVADDFRDREILDRPVEFVVRAVQGLPKGAFGAVRDAFHQLVDEDALVIFGPWVSENGVALRPFVEKVAQVPTRCPSWAECPRGTPQRRSSSPPAHHGGHSSWPGGWEVNSCSPEGFPATVHGPIYATAEGHVRPTAPG
ncbi:ABC transporter substrate-binding protein [Mycolicibacterium confluentis]|uniref:Uncharacterized protein n=1 Tax=Mycolicibacterium confluentis TaxID=28047 RepID=A0A7I7XWN9_9MYCO|nr:hypothetical protein [Mycolicibacterium confluentis]MCV7321882.1 hypothetical protein [Mycolicibacterium confluentis]ORV32136.1 hypothetical protein AWB99_10795 [Mycolicibacterium confluentis]BBZ33699.1 hypothetical protein MCNF_23040 [Mycolicibacterium confluentis]